MCLLHLWSSAYFCTDIATHLLREGGRRGGRGRLYLSQLLRVSMCVNHSPQAQVWWSEREGGGGGREEREGGRGGKGRLYLSQLLRVSMCVSHSPQAQVWWFEALTSAALHLLNHLLYCCSHPHSCTHTCGEREREREEGSLNVVDARHTITLATST